MTAWTTTFDFVIIGAGPAGEAAALQGARARGVGRRHRSTLVRRQLSAHRLPAVEVAAPRRRRASRQPGPLRLGARVRAPRLHGQPRAGCRRARRRRPRPAPRGGRRDGLSRRRPGSRPAARSTVRHDGATTRLPAGDVVVAVGSGVEGAAARRASTASPYWTNREATLARELPRSLLVLGGGPTGCELAQVYARFGVPTTIVQSGPAARADRPPAQLRGDPRGPRARRRHGPARRPGDVGREAGAGTDGAHVDRPRRRVDRRGPRGPARRRARLPARRPRARALRPRHERPDAVPARRPAADRRRPVRHRRPGRPGAAHPPGPLPGRAGGPDGARARRSRPTTARCRGRPTRTRRPPRSG